MIAQLAYYCGRLLRVKKKIKIGLTLNFSTSRSFSIAVDDRQK